MREQITRSRNKAWAAWFFRSLPTLIIWSYSTLKSTESLTVGLWPQCTMLFYIKSCIVWVFKSCWPACETESRPDFVLLIGAILISHLTHGLVKSELRKCVTIIHFHINYMKKCCHQCVWGFLLWDLLWDVLHAAKVIIKLIHTNVFLLFCMDIIPSLNFPE